VPGVNAFGRWAFAEARDCTMAEDFDTLVETLLKVSG
jgi:hypothetical protein